MRHTLVRILPYEPDQLFTLVGDVERYPEFVPWITSMRVWNRREEEGGSSQLDAEAGVGFSFLKERFSTRVRRDAGRREITVSLISGPFKHLTNRWRFSPHPSGTQIDFLIDFDFKSRLLQTLLAANMQHAIDRLIGCFEDRARVLYG
ncbi:type II toxin-antitoxin system RatA family toxin [Phenylobacterium montanum]|uniref:Type II toxin-antitoxin system RatA family toxin n=1 Tax=Phenylobacterium montanum TaxID=2823693 RepID=A0A975G1P4_9CAUL|nr:type II toxin-antitoxin system RatA family toxin [Caulobacter sp. S6]QUD88872.1 type II toxin-antitoxin system RatA family toxin [Caulobacter sp. S6]